MPQRPSGARPRLLSKGGGTSSSPRPSSGLLSPGNISGIDVIQNGDYVQDEANTRSQGGVPAELDIPGTPTPSVTPPDGLFDMVDGDLERTKDASYISREASSTSDSHQQRSVQHDGTHSSSCTMHRERHPRCIHNFFFSLSHFSHPSSPPQIEEDRNTRGDARSSTSLHEQYCACSAHAPDRRPHGAERSRIRACLPRNLSCWKALEGDSRASVPPLMMNCRGHPP